MRRLATAAVTAGVAAACLLGVTGTAQAAFCPWMDAGRPPAARAFELLSAMSLSDKVAMVTGADPWDPENPNPSAAGYVAANPRLCIPALVMNDATNGVGDAQALTTAFPDSIGLAATWDPQLARRYGQTLADEALAKGVNVLLGPGVDIARNPLAGRNFEYLGEDPLLAGQTAAAMIGGIQSQHVIATVKHFALNDQEADRGTDSSDASQRTEQEIDLPAFEMAVRAGVGAVMCSYNRINGVYACQNPDLLGDVLDDQFGFKGFVTSDWLATHATVASADAGLDIEMPFGLYYGAALQNAVQSGGVSTATLDQMVYRVLFTMFRLGLFDHVPAEGAQAAATPATGAASIAVADRVAEDGTVLLKDAGAILPLTGPGQRIAVIGPAANELGATLAEQGYGSGHVPELSYQPQVVAPFSAIAARAAQAGDVATYTVGDDLSAAAAAATGASAAVVFINDVETEGADRPDLNAHAGTCSLLLVFFTPTSCLYLPVDENALVAAVAAANPHTIVVVQSGDPIAMPWIDQVQGVIENWYPGQVDGDAIAPILFGDVDPSGKLPVTFPVALSDDPLQSAAQYPGVTEPGDPVGPHSSYSEGLLVGYRWYDAQGIAPLFPFGFGLAYTTFGFSGLSATTQGDGAVVRFTLQNTGARRGADTAQVYVGMPASTGEPPRQLKGFAKVWLDPGQARTLSIPLDASAFAHWDTASGQWVISAGGYQIEVGDSSRNLPLQATLGLPGRDLGPGAY